MNTHSIATLGIVIPTYNELGNIPSLLGDIRKQADKIDSVDFLVVIVDDSSPDGTGKKVKELSKHLKAANFKVVLINRSIKNGYGKACIEGMSYLLAEKADFILTMDADKSHNPIYLGDFINASAGHDLVIGSRYIKGGGVPDWSLVRKILSRGGNFYARVILGNKVSDYTGGYNMYSAELLKQLDINSIISSGYGFIVELKYRALKKSKAYCQLPIVFHDRKHGKSKLPKSTIINNLLLVPWIRFRDS